MNNLALQKTFMVSHVLISVDTIFQHNFFQLQIDIE